MSARQLLSDERCVSGPVLSCRDSHDLIIYPFVPSPSKYKFEKKNLDEKVFVKFDKFVFDMYFLFILDNC